VLVRLEVEVRVPERLEEEVRVPERVPEFVRGGGAVGVEVGLLMDWVNVQEDVAVCEGVEERD
jgi:hypothetical protein